MVQPPTLGMVLYLWSFGQPTIPMRAIPLQGAAPKISRFELLVDRSDASGANRREYRESVPGAELAAEDSDTGLFEEFRQCLVAHRKL